MDCGNVIKLYTFILVVELFVNKTVAAQANIVRQSCYSSK